MLQRRFFCTNFSKTHDSKWRVKQVTKSNFSETLEEIKTYISDSDFIAISLQKTGSFSAGWHRVLTFDTADTAYFKAKRAAERFQVLQFAVCPFSFRDSTVVAHPYNFHLFPRDELKVGMPSYSFSCQPSYLTSMAKDDFDFNICIYDGISYLSRAQESATTRRLGNPITSSQEIKSSSSPSVADSIFSERIKARIKNWRNMLKGSSKKTDETLASSLRKIVFGCELYGSRPCLNIDVCSERQVQLVLEIFEELNDDIIPLVVPAKGGGTQAVRVVLTSSNEDKIVFKKELEDLEEEQNRKIRGFREVIDLISTSKKPLVTHNSLNDLTFLHSKFVSPLPPEMSGFLCSLRLVFPHVLDINNLMMEVSPFKKVKSLPAAVSVLKKRLLDPINMDISLKDYEGKIHGQNALRITYSFAKLCSILKISPNTSQSDDTFGLPASSLESYLNTFRPFLGSSLECCDGEVRIWAGDTRNVSTDNLVFLWGYGNNMSAGALKNLLQGIHGVFSGEYDVRIVDKSCAVIVFWQPGLSKKFLEIIDGSEFFCKLSRDMVLEGLRAASYETYKRACCLGFWEADLADSLDKALSEVASVSSESSSLEKPSEICWDTDSMINLDDL